MWWIRLLNRFGLRKDTMACMTQEDALVWPSYLGSKTAGVCEECKRPIYFEKQNRPFYKICHRCAFYKGYHE